MPSDQHTLILDMNEVSPIVIEKYEKRLHDEGIMFHTDMEKGVVSIKGTMDHLVFATGLAKVFIK